MTRTKPRRRKPGGSAEVDRVALEVAVRHFQTGHDEACPSSAGLDFSVLRGFVYSCGPIPLSPRRNMNESRDAAKARRREVEVFLLLECISACFSPSMESADGANLRRLVPGRSMLESASSPKSADEVDRGWEQVRRRRLILLANWRGMLRRAWIERRASPLAPPLTLNSAQGAVIRGQVM